MAETVYAFDVFTADHDDVKTGAHRRLARRSRVLVSATAYPTYGAAADVAACLAVARHGGMPLAVLARH